MYVQNKVLANLKGVGDEVVKRFSSKMPPIANFWGVEGRRKTYDTISHFVSERIDSVYSESDITSLVLGSEADLSKQEKTVLGLYTGILVDLLTQRNNAENKRTVIHVDGHGMEFPCLFSGARYFDEIYVKNFTGDEICSNLGSDGGEGNNVLIMNVNGYKTGGNIASYGGSVRTIVIMDSKSERFCENVAGNGKADMIIAKNTEEAHNFRFAYAGACGSLGMYIADNCSLPSCIWPGYIGVIVLKDLNVRNLFHTHGDLGVIEPGCSLLNILIFDEQVIKYSCARNEKGYRKTINIDPTCLDKIVRQYRISDILKFANEMRSGSAEEITNSFSQINEAYSTIRNKLETMIERRKFKIDQIRKELLRGEIKPRPIKPKNRNLAV